LQISGVLSGEYLLNGIPLIIGDSDVDWADLTKSQYSTIHGTIKTDPPTSTDMSSSPIGRFVLTGIRFNTIARPTIQRDGSFTMDVPSDDYVLTMEETLPQDNKAYIKSARLGNQDALDVLHIGSTPSSPLEIVMS